MIYDVALPALRRLPPEKAHSLTLDMVRMLGRVKSPPPAPATPFQLMGLSFSNRVGLAAGFDKNGVAVDGWFALGFGHVEVGTVTPQPQAGNPLPRVFRLIGHAGVINRMGFPNDGAERVAARLRKRQAPGVVGVNIGKNAVTPLERAIDDYIACLRIVFTVADYVTVNVSSPNTAGLRSLQDVDHLVPLLSGVLEEARVLEKQHGRKVPLLVKLSPDMTEEELRRSGAAAASVPVAGIIATNTTLSRESVADDPLSQEKGGLSGRPLFIKSCAAVRILREAVGPTLPIIGVGGVSSAADARLLHQSGANLVQLYTGMIYQGTRLVRELVTAF
jgi:dihydroorotate dehydrogenase